MAIKLICQQCGKEYFTRDRQAKRSKYCSFACLGAHNGHTQWIDLSGQRFGRVLVLSPNGHSHHCITYLCQCDCGKQFTTMSTSLKCGDTQSCGCLGREHAAIASSAALIKPILSSTRFGRWTVQNRSGKNNHNQITYACICDCGTHRDVDVQSLKSGKSKSCGCYKRDQIIKRLTTHGMTSKPGFARWRGAVRREADSEWTPQMSNAILELQTVCTICGSTKVLTIDHVNPVSKGFGLKPGNAAVLCKSCNSKKNNKLLHDLPFDWQEKISKAAKEFADYWKVASSIVKVQ